MAAEKIECNSCYTCDTANLLHWWVGRESSTYPETTGDRQNISMESLSLRSLQDLCIDLLTKRTDILWTGRKRPLFLEPEKVEWKDPEVFLNSDIADKLLEMLNYENNLDDSTLSTFTDVHVHLQRVKISFCDTVLRGWGLEALKYHKLISLVIVTSPREWDGNIVHTVLKFIGNKSYESLQHLAFCQISQGDDESNVPGRIWPDDDDALQQSVETLSRFNCLQSLDVRGIDLTDTNLAILGKSLPHVENLDLSWNLRITDISPLKNCQKTLKSLSLGELYGLAAESTLATFVTLSGLTYLDVSLKFEDFPLAVWMNLFFADKLLQNPDVLPNLVCLDLSGRTVNSEHALRQFLDAHRSLQSLIVWGSDACEFESLQDYRPRLTVGGHVTLEQYTAALRHYNRRDKDRPMADDENCRRFLVSSLYSKLLSKPFPPCLDDQLVQELLDSIPTCSSFLSDICQLYCAFWCVLNIAVLLKEGIVTRLEPETKRRVLLLCQRTCLLEIQIPEIDEAHKAARQILQSLGGPVPALRNQIGTEEDIP